MRTARLDPYMPTFGLTWENCKQLLTQLDSSVQVSIITR